MRSYRTISAAGSGEIEVKHSRFRAIVQRADSEAQAREVVAAQRRTHHDARHHCSAFVLGPDAQTERSNDDGEPAGTAGMPILDVLRGAGLSDVVAVVTRWFGGTLLGAGGLVRAYADATSLALESATTTTRSELSCFDLDVPAADIGRVEAALRARGAQVTGTSYGHTAVLHLATDRPADLGELVASVTAGAGLLRDAGVMWVEG